MRKILIFICIAFVFANCRLPKPINNDFEGKFVYLIDAPGNTPDLSDSINYQIVYAKDSMLRIDSYTPIGKQIYIEHIPRKKAYILMDLGSEKVAIQTFTDTVLHENPFIYSYFSGKESIAGINSSKISVYDKERDTTIVMNYYPKISAKYSTAYGDMPGLPVKYSIFSKDYWLHYTLISLEEKRMGINLFGIPSDYNKITFDEFIERIQGD